MSLKALGILGRRSWYRTQFHSSGIFSTKKAVKRHRSVKHALDFQGQKQIMVDFIQKGSLQDLDVVKESAINAGQVVDQVSFDSRFLETCSELGAFDLGKEYFNNLYSSSRAGIGVIGKYFAMCHADRNRCSADDQKFLLEIYDTLLAKYEVLDARTCEALIKGIVLTDRWKKELPRMLEMVKLGDATPSSSFISSMVCGALHQRDVNVVWDYMDLFVSYNKPVLSQTYETILSYGGLLPRLLRWMETHGIILSKECAEVFVRLAPSQRAEAKFTRVPQSGVCQSCRKPLKPALLTNEEFARLGTAFLDPVLIGRDVFQKTRPQELKDYHEFLDKVLPVDVVLDGLNIAYASRQSSQGSKLLCGVTSFFASKSNKILIVGREHMKNWPAKDMNFISSKAKMFLADNISQDDPFLLYAALRSGMGTKFVSRDRMSSHRFLLKCPDLRRIFTKWQALHQYHPLNISVDKSSIVIRDPYTFVREPQNTDKDLWHLPVVDNSQAHVEGHLQDEYSPWLCLKI